MDNRLLNIDQYGVLKPSAEFWLSCLVLSRYCFLLLGVFFSGQLMQTMQYFAEAHLPWWPVCGEMFAIGLIVAAGRRSPDAGPLLRWVWRNAAFVAACVAGFHLVGAAYTASVTLSDISRAHVALMGFCVLDGVVVWVFWRSPYFRALFAEFPQPQSDVVNRM